jgi:hypothetical protein
MPHERKYQVEDNSEAVQALVEKVGEKGFTPLQNHFADWITERAAPEFKTAKEREAFRLGAGFGLVLRMEHQRSPENHEFKATLQGSRAEQEAERAEQREARAAERAKAREEKAAAPKPARRAKAAEEEAPAPAPKRRGRPPAAKATVTEPEEAAAPKRPGRPAAKAGVARRPAAAARPGRPATRKSAVTEPDF